MQNKLLKDSKNYRKKINASLVALIMILTILTATSFNSPQINVKAQEPIGSCNCDYECIFPDNLTDKTTETMTGDLEGELHNYSYYDLSSIDTTDNQTQTQLWNIDSDVTHISLEFEFIGMEAGHSNVLGYYLDSDPSTWVGIFEIEGSDGHNHSNYDLPVFSDGNIGDKISIDNIPVKENNTIGFGIDTENGSIYKQFTENDLNPNKNDRALVFELCDNNYGKIYVLCFEDLRDDSHKDFNDALVLIRVTECCRELDPGNIIIDKVTDPSGNPQKFEFNPSWSDTNFFLNDTDPYYDSGPLDPGTYTITETVPSGWTLTSIDTFAGTNPDNVTINSNTATIELGSGDCVSLRYTNTQNKSQIIVDKVTDPSGDPQEFTFNPSWGSTFTLTDQSTPHSSGELSPGQYTISETVPSGWTLTSINGAHSTNGNTATINVESDKSYTVTFTNTKNGTIEIIKNSIGGNDTFNFTSSTLGDFQLTTVDNTAQKSFTNLPPGTYDVDETVPDGWNLNSVSVSDRSSISSLDLDPGETIIVTFNNTKDDEPFNDDEEEPEQTIQLGSPIIKNEYYTGQKWLDLIGGQTPVWINSSDEGSGTSEIWYKVSWSENYNTWTNPPWIEVKDNDVSSDPRYHDADRTIGNISIRLTFDISCFHEIHAWCWDKAKARNKNESIPVDFMVDADAPKNDGFEYIGPKYVLPGGARFISDETVKRIWANDTGCTGGVAGVCKLEWRLENWKTQLIAEGYVGDGDTDDTILYGDQYVIVSGDLDDDPGEIMIEIRILDECRHYLYHRAVDCLGNAHVDGVKQEEFVDITPPGINKTLPDHGYNDTIAEQIDGVHTGYLKAGEKITLEAEDNLSQAPVPCNSGLEALFFRWTWMDGNYPAEEELDGDWLVVNGSELCETYGWDDPEIANYWWYRVDSGYAEIIFNNECRHDLYYFAKDNVWNHGEVQHQRYLVDEGHPDVKLDLPDHGYEPIDDEGTSGYIKGGEPFYFNASDISCYEECKAGIESIFWRYEYDNDSDSIPENFPSGLDQYVISGEEIYNRYGEDYNLPEIRDYYWYKFDGNYKSFQFNENCTHKLYYFTKDNVCHRSKIYDHTFYVDDGIPNYTIEYPDHGYYEGCYNHLKCNTNLTINAYDLPDTECKAGIETIFFRYEFNDSDYPPEDNIYGYDTITGAKLVELYGEAYNIDSITDHLWFRVNASSVNIFFKEQCYHELYFFIKDNLCHRTDIQYRDYYVDNTPPTVYINENDLSKHGYYYNDTEEKGYIKADMHFNITAVDCHECSSEIETIFFRYEFNDNDYPPEDNIYGYDTITGAKLVELYGEAYNNSDMKPYQWYRINDTNAEVWFAENCTHKLYYFAKDNVCNPSQVFDTTFYVDDIYPEIRLDVSGHGYYYNETEQKAYLRAGKHFTLESGDSSENEECDAGIETIFFRYEWVDPSDGTSHYPEEGNIYGYDTIDGAKLVTLYGSDYDTSTITQYKWFRVNKSTVDVWFEEECRHQIWYFTKDNVCHRSHVFSRPFYVDDSDPDTWLSYPNEHGYDMDDTGSDSSNLHIKCGKEITIHAEDKPDNDCAAGIEGIFYRVYYNGVSHTEGTGTVRTGTSIAENYSYTNPEIINHDWMYVESTEVNVSFNENCEHKLYWFAKDNICHATEVYNETFYVDCSGPTLEFTYPDHGYYQDGGTYYLKEDTPITVTATDHPDNDCKAGIESIFWRYEWNGECYPTEGEDDAVNGTQLESDYGYTDPTITDYWWYRVNGNTTQIEFDEQCVHNLSIFAKDNVCNRGDIYTRTYNVDEKIPNVQLNVNGHGYYEDRDNVASTESEITKYLRKGKQFTLEANDDNGVTGCNSGIETIFFRYKWDNHVYPEDGNIYGFDIINGTKLVDLYGEDYNDIDITDHWWFRVNDSIVNLYFNEECTHYIEWFAKDNVCHRTDMYNEVFHVDDSIPEIYSETPDEHGYYYNETEDKMYMRVGKHVDLHAYDLPDNDCAAGIENTFFRYEWNGTEFPGPDESGWNIRTGQSIAENYSYTDPAFIGHNWYTGSTETRVTFNEECEHDLYFWAKDNVCHNSTMHHEKYYVDNSSPIIDLEVGDPNCTTDCPDCDGWCITNETQITITTSDLPNNECMADIEGIFWRYEFSGNTYPDDPNPDMNILNGISYSKVTGQNLIDWYEYSYANDSDLVEHDWYYTESDEVILNFSKECTHVLYYWAKDNVCHHTDVKCVNFSVDLTPPPKPIKTIDGFHAKLENPEGYPEDYDQWMIYPGTKICFNATDDVGPHSCGPFTIEYRVWYLGSWTDWMEYEECLSFTEGCLHILEARVKDCLGHTSEVDNESFWVCAPGGDSGPDITIIKPSWDETYCDRTLEVLIDASDSQTPKEELTVIAWIPAQDGAPRLYYYPEYNVSKYGDEYFHTFIDIYKYQDGTQLVLEALALDGDGNYKEAMGVPFNVCSNVLYDQWMDKGWNSLTLPWSAIPCDNSTGSVLASIDGHYDAVFYYNEIEDDWDSYVPDRGYNPLGTLEEGKQYWIHISGEGLRFFTDTNGPTVTIEYPENETILTNEYLSQDIWGTATDVETGIDEVKLAIYDENTSKFWNGENWVTEETLNNCSYNSTTEEWVYKETDNIDLTNCSGHVIYLGAFARDMVGCYDMDIVWFKFIDTNNPDIDITYPVDEDTYNDCIEPSEIKGTCVDLETVVTSTYIQIKDQTDNTWWDGATWGSKTDLNCIINYSASPVSWEYKPTVFPNWLAGHDYSIYATGYDAAGNSGTDDALFNFICETQNNPPYIPNTPTPANESTVDLDVAKIKWYGGDPDVGDEVRYEHFFGPNPSSLTSYGKTTWHPYDHHGPFLSNLGIPLDSGVTYYWKIVAEDNHSAVSESPVWQFTTKAEDECDEVINIEKTVWNFTCGEDGCWDDSITACENSFVDFNISIEVPEDACTTCNGNVTDLLPAGLDYLDGSTSITVKNPGDSVEYLEIEPIQKSYATSGNRLIWNETNMGDPMVFSPGTQLYFYFTAKVTAFTGSLTNTATINAYYECIGEDPVSTTDTAFVSVGYC